MNEFKKNLENNIQYIPKLKVSSTNTSNYKQSFKNMLEMANNANFMVLNKEPITDVNTLIDDMIPDENFSSVLNNNLEVTVENKIYKVTPYGTFSVRQDKYDDLLTMLDEKPYQYGQDLSRDSFYSNPQGNGIYMVAPGVELLDTYEASSNNINEVIKLSEYPIEYNNTYQFRTDADAYIYDNIPTIGYGGKTWAGKLIESILGRDEVHTENYGTNRRVKVNFYNLTWGVYSAIGISVKMQKKNWIGWSGTEASELRLGWDAMEYYCDDAPIPPSAPFIAAPQKFTKLDIPKLTKDYVQVDLLGYEFKFDRNTTLQKGIKKLHEFLPKIPGLKPKTDRNENYAYKVWSDRALKNISTILDRDEIIAFNTESINKTLDWSVGFKLTWDFNDALNFGYAPLKFKITRVFGIAKYGNEWKGARIVSDKF